MRDGVSQSERKLEALLPSYVKLDERSREDMLLFLSGLATQFNYYNTQNKTDGDWKDFIQADLLIMIVTISRLDFTSWQQQQIDIQQALDLADNDIQLHLHLAELFNLIYGIAIELGDHLRQLKKADQQGITWRYTDQILEAIEADIHQLLQFEQQAAGLFRNTQHFRTIGVTNDLSRLFPLLSQRSAGTPPVFLGYQSLTECYNELRSKYYQVTSAAQFYLKRQPDVMEHHPHIGLLMTFLHLYGHLQDRLNALTGDHLSYYYRHVLGIQQKKAIPDLVHVFMDMQPQSMPVIVPKGAAMMVETGNGKPPVTFRLSQDLKVNHTRIGALKTVYVNSYRQITAEDPALSDIIETQVYAAVRKVSMPADYMPGTLPVPPWPLLGEPQEELPADKRTMSETDMGLVLASPLFYLTEGKRTVDISLHFEPASFAKLQAYVKNFAAVTKKKEAMVMKDLLSAAFVISYTTPTGWFTLSKHSIYTNNGEGGNSITITLLYDPNAPAAAIYDPALHGHAFQTRYPLVKLLLNNNSFHHPYSFLPLLWLERVAIRSRVQGYRSVKLFNNAGPLSPANPFQLFGAQPAVGSFLDIRDSNIFNTYTKSFCINLEWLELPLTEDGFKGYYAAYEAGINNDSFKAGISTYEDGQYQPAREHQQLLTLFETRRDEEGRILLSDKSSLSNIDLRKLHFYNKPMLDKEPFITDGFYTDGTVRLELATPNEAFGHKRYMRLFPEIVTHNASRWAKKKPLPNMPYTPLVKSISIDYTLEQAEILKPEKAIESDNDLQLFHLYPFGHRLAYPSAMQEDFSLLPFFEDRVSLYIGLADMKPQEDISLFFQLEEKQRVHTNVKQAPQLHWSYLYNDRWMPFNTSQQLGDTTQLFLNSGIVTLQTPAFDCAGNTRLDKDLQWIRLSSKYASDTCPMVRGIFMNAAVACRELSDTATGTTLAPMSIKALHQEVRGIQRLWQLFPSFGGRPAETTEEYYIRVSERLRHKNRPLCSVDIIQLILEAFPEILIVKCVRSEESDIKLIIVPRPATNETYINTEPQADIATLYRIFHFIKNLLPPFLKVTVHHPAYEKVKIICDVCFVDRASASDKNHYLVKLQDDIRRYLTPWLFDTAVDVQMGGTLYIADILNFIKKLPYISYVTGFSMVHFFEETDEYGNIIHCMLDTAASDTEYVRASMPEAVLIPAPHHSIRVLDSWEYRDPVPVGISGVITGEELIIGQHERHSYREDHDSHYTEGEIISLTIQPK